MKYLLWALMVLSGCMPVRPYIPETPLQIGMTEQEAVKAMGSSAICILAQSKDPGGVTYIIRILGARNMLLRFNAKGTLVDWQDIKY